MPATLSPRLGLPAPVETDPADVPADVVKLRDALDPIAVVFLAGVASALPPAGTPGRIYFATDLHTLFYDDGATWQQPGHAPGDLKISAAPALPGWLPCDGAAVSRVNYPALFATVGVAFGPGDGTNTFNVPDLRGRSPVGAGAGAGLTARALGAKGGEESHVLAAGEMAPHTHGYSGTTAPEPQEHTHGPGNGSQFMTSAQGVGAFAGTGVAGAVGVGSGNFGAPTNNNNPWGVTVATGGRSAAHNHTFGGSTDTGAGVGGGGHNNMAPFAVVNVFIKT